MNNHEGKKRPLTIVLLMRGAMLVVATLLSIACAPKPPNPPAVVAATPTDSVTILVSWTPTPGTNGYLICYDNGPNTLKTALDTVWGWQKNSQIFPRLQPGTYYRFSLRSFVGSDNAHLRMSNTIQADTTTPQPTKTPRDDVQPMRHKEVTSDSQSKTITTTGNQHAATAKDCFPGTFWLSDVHVHSKGQKYYAKATLRMDNNGRIVGTYKSWEVNGVWGNGSTVVEGTLNGEKISLFRKTTAGTPQNFTGNIDPSDCSLTIDCDKVPECNLTGGEATDSVVSSNCLPHDTPVTFEMADIHPDGKEYHARAVLTLDSDGCISGTYTSWEVNGVKDVDSRPVTGYLLQDQRISLTRSEEKGHDRQHYNGSLDSNCNIQIDCSEIKTVNLRGQRVGNR